MERTCTRTRGGDGVQVRLPSATYLCSHFNPTESFHTQFRPVRVPEVGTTPSRVASTHMTTLLGNPQAQYSQYRK